MIPGHRLAAVEILAEGGTGWGEKRAPARNNAAEFALPHHMRDCLPPLAAGAPHLVEHGTKGERAGGAERTAAQELPSVVAEGHHGAANLVVELGLPKELEVAVARKQCLRGGVQRTHHVQIVRLEHELALGSLGVMADGAVAAVGGWERHRVAP
jgi:hypothetical protein